MTGHKEVDAAKALGLLSHVVVGDKAAPETRLTVFGRWKSPTGETIDVDRWGRDGCRLTWVTHRGRISSIAVDDENQAARLICFVLGQSAWHIETTNPIGGLL